MYFQFLVLFKSQLKCLEEQFNFSLTNEMISYNKSLLPHFLRIGTACQELDNAKETQKSQNRSVLCWVVEVKQYYCLSYRMWKGVISCLVPGLIDLQDFHSI